MTTRKVYEMPKPDMVNAPESDLINKAAHYNQSGGIECIEALKAQMSHEQFVGFLRGQVAKYLWRAPHKGSEKQDYQKAEYYLKRLIKETQDNG